MGNFNRLVKKPLKKFYNNFNLLKAYLLARLYQKGSDLIKPLSKFFQVSLM